MIATDFYYYSVMDGSLIGSESPLHHPDPEKVSKNLVEKFKFNSVVVLEERCDEKIYDGLDVRHRSLSSSRPPTVDEIQPIVLEILELIRLEEKVWVHCSMGIDRTGCVLGGVLGIEYGDADRAIEEVYGCFPVLRQSGMMCELWEPYARIVQQIHAGRSTS